MISPDRLPRSAILLACGLATGLAAAAGPVAGQRPGRSVPDSVPIVQLERHLLNRPADTRAHIELARLYGDDGRDDDAEALLRAGLERAADPDQIRWALVQHLAGRERWREALAVVEPLVAAGDTTAIDVRGRLLTNAGLAAYRVGDTDRARADWERALAVAPGSRMAALNLTQLLVRLGEPDSARAVASAALRHHPADERLLYLRAMTDEGESGLVEAIEATRRLYDSNPDDQALGLQLAGLYRMAREGTKAMAIYTELLERSDPSEVVYATVAEYWLGGRLYDRTAELLDTGLDRYPRSGRLWMLLGEAEAGREAWEAAEIAYSQAIVHVDAPSEAKLMLADVHASAGDTAAAVGVLRGMDRTEGGRGLLLRSARKAEELGAVELAGTIYGALLDGDGDDVVALEGAARTAEAEADTSTAVRFYERAMGRDSAGPGPPLGLLRLTTPGRDSATTLLRKAAWRGVERLGHVELAAASSVSGQTDARQLSRAAPVVARAAELREMVRTVLDTIVFETDWGPTELDRLRRGFPDTRLLETYAARLAAHEGRDSTALAMTRSLVRRYPEAVELHRDLARLTERTRGSERALGAWRHALELEPGHESTFRAALAAHRTADSLETLLEQVERLRAIDPESRVLAEYQIELLHRLGRLEEAAAVARSLEKATEEGGEAPEGSGPGARGGSR